MSRSRGFGLFASTLALVVALLAPGLAFADESSFSRLQIADSLPVQLEIIRDVAGPLGVRVRSAGGDWRLPPGNAVLLEEDWWTPLRPLAVATGGRRSTPSSRLIERVRERIAPAATRRLPDRLTAASIGDVTLDGQADLVLSFRRPFKRNFINITRPRRVWADDTASARTSDSTDPSDLSEIWVAGTLVRPVTALAACDGALAVAYGKLDRARHRRDRRLALGRLRLPADRTTTGTGRSRLRRHRW